MLALSIGLFSITAGAETFRKLGELELRLTALSAIADPSTITVPKNTASGIRVAIRSGGSDLSSAEVARLLGGGFAVEGELSGPGLRAPIHLPQQPPAPGADPFLLNIPSLPQAGDYTLANLRVTVNGATALDIAPQKVAVTVIDQVLITSVTTRPLTLDEIRQKGIVLDSNAYLGFEFTLGLSLDSKAVEFTFPVVFDKRGVAVPQPALPPMVPERAEMPPLTTIVPMLLKPPSDDVALPEVTLPNGEKAEVRIPSVLVIPGNVGYLKQFFSAKLFVANGAPGGSNLTVRDVVGKIRLPAGADNVLNTLDDPLTLPDTKNGPQLSPMPVRSAGLDGQLGTGDDVGAFAPGQQGEAEFLIRGEKEGFHTINFDVEATLDGLVTGPVKVTGAGQGGVLVRNPYFDMTFTAPAVVRNGEQFTLFATVNNISQSIANAVTVTLDASRIAGAHLVGPGVQTIDTILARDSRTLQFRFQADRTGQLVATYLNFETQNGTTGNLKFTLGVGERGVPLSPDTLVLPAATSFVPQDVLSAAMRVLGQAWSVTNAPSGTLPSGVIRTTKEVVTQKALALAEAGLRINLGQPQMDAVRDLLFDFYGGSTVDAGFDQILRSTSAGTELARAIGAALQLTSETSGGAAEYERQVAQIAASGPDFVSFAVGNATGAPVTVSVVDAQNRRSSSDATAATFTASEIPSAVIVPFGTTATASRMGLIASPIASPYKLEMTGTGSGTINLSVTIPNGNGSFIHATASSVPVTPAAKYSLGLDPGSPLVLQIDADANGNYETSQPLTSATLFAQGPRLISATVIGPETLTGAGPFGFSTAVLFDRIVDPASSSNTANYTIAKNKVLSARRQLSGRLVFLSFEQPEGPYVATQLAVSNIADGKRVLGPPATTPLRSRLTDIGAAVSGRVINADGTPVRNLALVYAQNPELTCAPPLDDITGLTQVRTDDNGRYEFRYVRQDTCGMPFQITTTDPNTGAARTLSSSVRVAGEQIVLDIAFFGRGSVTGTVRNLTGAAVGGADVFVISQTDTQSNGATKSDISGHYRIDNIVVGPIMVHAVQGVSLGRTSGRIDRAGTATVVDVTLDGGTVRASGIVRRVQGALITAVPSVQVAYYIESGDGLFIPIALATTDTNGAYAFEGMPTGAYRIEAALNSRDKGAATGIAAAGDVLVKDIAIVIGAEGSGTIRGLVKFPDGAVAAGVVVSIDDRGVLSNFDGTFELSPVVVKPFEQQRIVARSLDGLRAGLTSVLVSQPNQIISNVVIVLSGIGSVEFTVLDASRNPVPDQDVALFGECANPCGCASKKTDVNGKVRFEGVPLGTAIARATRTAFDSLDQATGTATLLSDGATAFGVMQFTGFGSVTGTVLNPDNSPALGADVKLMAKVFNEDICSLVEGIAQRVRTDAAGKFRFTGVNVGNVSVSVSHPFFTTNVGARGTLSKNGDTVDFALKLVNTISGVLSGTVYLPDGRTPAGAGVEVTAFGPLPDVTVTTDANGHFQFAKIFPEGTYNVTARDAATGGVRREQLYLRAAQDVTHDFRLKGRGTVNVKVVNGAGQPVTTSAFVRLEESEYPNRTYEAALEAANNGIATFTNVFEGPLTATASDAFARGGRASSVLASPGATLDMTVAMTTTGTVKGHFYKTDGVTPIPFGGVRLVINGTTVGQATTNGTDDVGAFTFTYVPAGPVRLEAQDPQTARSGVAAGSVTSEGEVVTLDIRAQGLGTVQGLVTSNGAAQPGAQVMIDAGQIHASTITDSTGRYSIDGLPEGRVVATASLSGNFLTGTNSGVLSGEASTLTLDVALRDSGKISGKVVNADGVTAAPLSYVTALASGATLSTTSDTQGNFTFDRVPTGSVSLSASVLGGIDKGSATTDVAANATANATIMLNGVGSITGRALDSGGLPIAGDITITGSGAFPYSFTVQSQSDGNFALPQVLAGPFAASLRAKSGEFFLYGTTSSNVGAGQTANVTVQVQPSGTVTALVVRSNGTTSAVGANVTLQLDPNRGTVSLQTGTDGRFTARGVPLGAFTVRVNDPITTGLALKTGRIDNNGDTADLGTMVLDDKPLTVVSVTPTDGTTGVPINTSVVLTFSNVLQSAFGISIYDGATPLGATATFSPDGKTVTLNGTWPDSKELTVSVSTSVTDIFGRHPLTSSSTKFRTVDLTPPRVSTIVPANGAFQVDPSSAITITFNEPITGTADVVVSSTTGTTTATSPTTIVFTPSAPLAINTIYTVNVNGAIDTSGNHQTVAFTSSFSTTDTIAPSVTIASPTAAWIRNTRPQIQINSTDATSGVNAAAATLRLDGNIVAPSVSGTTLFFTPSTDLADGNHTIAASVPDRAGNAGIANGSFGVDITAPGAATITSITEGQLLKGNVTLTASATDATSGVAKIEVFADDVLIATLNAPSFSGVFNSAALPDGAHVLTARATDVAGNAGAVGTAVHVTTDNTPLTVAFTSPQPNQPLRDTVIATAVPNRAVTRIDFTLGTQTNSVTSAPYTTTFSLSALAQGQQTINAAAFGTDGQTASATVTFIVDRTAPPAPDVTRITAEPGANATATVLGQSGAIEGNARIEIRNLNNGFLGTFAAAADGSFVAAIQGVQDDTLSLVAIDVAGNRSSSSTISVKQNPSLPVISWTCSSPGAMVPTGYAAKLRVFALGNNQGNTANVVQKVEFYIAGSPTPVLGTAVSGVANNYETTYTVTGADGTSIPVLAVVTNTAGTTAEVSTSITIVSGVSITTNTTIDAANTTYENQTLIIRSGTTTITGEHSFARLIVLDGATVTHPRTDLPADRLSIGSATPGDIYVSCNGAIDVTGKGYADVLNGFGHTDPSASSGSRTPSGGSHGGEGGGGQPGATYGSPFDPNELGAAGSWGSNCGNCVAGGGIARLKGKTVVVDGRIWSHAKLVDQGGQASGAGGSIRIDAELLSGGGEIRAEGIGRGDFEGSGGGGRIAVYYRNLSFDRSKITAAGGANTNAASVGAAGTVYFRQVDAAGLKISDQLVIDNRGRVAPNRAGIPMIGVGSVVSVSGATVTVGGSIPDGVQGFFIEFLSSAAAVVSRYEIASRTSATTIVLKLAPGETQANVPIPGTYRGVLSVDQFTLRASGSLTMSGVIAAKNVSMTSTTLRHPLSTGSTVHRLEFDVDTLTIDSTSAIDASGGGYANITGTGETYPGVSGSFGKAGGSHGGRGGPYVGTPGATYGSITNPNEAGAAGSGGNCFACATGGGIVRIKANSLVLNGKIWSNAGGVTLGGFSSGAAGSIRLDVASLSGTGEIHAEGNGRGDFEGSGGGGRIAVYYQSMSFDKTKIIAQGGANTTPSSVGGPGSVYFQQVDATGAKISEQTLYDNRGRVTQATLPFAPAITGTISAVSGATVTVSSTLPEGIEKMLVEFFNASGALVSTYRIAARTSATTMVVELAPGESQANAPVPGTFRVVWRFDNLVINGAGTIEMTGILRAGSLAVSNRTFFTQPVFAGTINRLTIQVDNDFTLDSTSGIDVTGRGFNDSLNGGGRTWNGYAGGNRSGGSHGGQGGGSSPGPTYGSAYDPDTPGAAGSGDNCGNCGAGGGIARVQAKNFVLDGKILSNAGVPNAGQGSGAGGSIRIDAETFGGLGEIHADGTGRSTFEGAGGGGRIAVYYTTMTFDRAKIFAIGGPHNNAANVGAPGTIFLKSSTQSYGELLIDNRTAIAANKTTLPGVGPRTVSSYTIDTLRDAAAHFQFPNHLRGLRVFLGTSTAQNWPIIANDETSVQLDVTNAILVPQTGQAFRGLHKLDALKLRNAKVETTDYVEVSTPVDKDGTSTLTTGGPPPP